MNVRRGNLGTGVCLLLAATATLHAQITTYGCPQGVSQIDQLNGFTAGTPADGQICMTGPSGTFSITSGYNVTVKDTLLNTTATVVSVQPFSDTLLLATIPQAFFQTVQTPGQSDPVTVSIEQLIPAAPPPLTSTFQINPPFTANLVFISAVNQPVTWNLDSNGTGPYNNELFSGGGPAGMPAFPLGGQTWSGTPTATGVFPFNIALNDSWFNQLTLTENAYVAPLPQITGLSQTSTVAGSPNLPIDITGSNLGIFGFVHAFNINATAVPGSSVEWTTGVNQTSLTPTNVTPTDVTVTLPANLLTTTGIHSLSVLNPGPSTSNAVVFTVNPSITGLSTYSRTAGAPSFSLGVVGTGFVNGSVVRLNGSSLVTSFVDTSHLTALFPSIPNPGTELITVLNPDTTLTPVPQSLIVVQPPTINLLNPASVNAGSPAFQLTVIGAHLQSEMTVYFNSVPLITSLIGTSLAATVPAEQLTSAAVVPVYVGTPDGYSTSSLPFTINPTGPPPLQLTTFSILPAGVVNTPYSTTFTAVQGAGGYSFSVIAGSLPAGLQLSSAGVLSGTPTAVGASQFSVQVVDSAKGIVSRQFTLNILPQPLTLTTGPLDNTLVNVSISVQFAGNGGVPPYTFVEFGALPPGVSISSAGLLSGTPTKAGTYPFLLFVDDTAGAFASKNFTLNVAPPGLLITPPSPLTAGQINVPYTMQLAATGGSGTPYLWSATGLPDGLTIANNTGLIAGIPRAAGSFKLSVTVNDYNGGKDTQPYTLVIAASAVSITSPSLPNGAVGSSYSAAVTASGGSGALTFTATSLPPGVSLTSAGILSGTPTTAGTYTVVVTATDAAGATASATSRVTIAPPVVVTPVTLSNAILGTAIAPVQMAATGGTSPYQWQSATLPPGLNLALNGTLSGTPTTAGTFSFTVFAVDSNGALASGTEQLTVALPTAPAATIGGAPPTVAPATQQFLQVSLADPFAATITANLTLTFAPTSGADDPAIQFATGGRTAQITIPAGYTTGLTSVGVQTGTVAGVITITAQLLAGTVNVTPTPAPKQTITVTAGAPVITAVTATRTSTGFTVTVTGYASNRGVDSGTFQFSASEGSSLQTTQLNTTDTSLFTQWYGSSTSAPFGSQFKLSQPFTVNGSNASVLAVTVTLSNALGTSPAASANLQ